ncbi:MAG: Unknown protein [uncultured Thiotrichaceae bacterium]|uniref:Uncharacterized protein n=1 Tax=uncultured Thiotrichaceae bacterium TaxID=298394 RepID=A0A6S6SUY9_9GAMM|nr:MAG: Unknown protein [uncultured Thiotrichaceae bacterium]
MQTYFRSHDKSSYAERLSTARRLLDGLVIYRAELGETGRELEQLLRLRDVQETLDAPYSRCVH